MNLPSKAIIGYLYKELDRAEDANATLLRIVRELLTRNANLAATSDRLLTTVETLLAHIR
jgi:hypothetical protein